MHWVGVPTSAHERERKDMRGRKRAQDELERARSSRSKSRWAMRAVGGEREPAVNESHERARTGAIEQEQEWVGQQALAG
jgi:hypothetical protein